LSLAIFLSFFGRRLWFNQQRGAVDRGCLLHVLQRNLFAASIFLKEKTTAILTKKMPTYQGNSTKRKKEWHKKAC
jgi:hypothetical protein